MLRRSGGLAVGVTAALLTLSASASLSIAATVDDVPPTGNVRVVAAPSEAAGDAASALVSGMSLREKAAGVVMGHIPTTDAGALASYMADTGIGGFTLMGANIPATEGELRALTAALTPDASLPPLIAIDQEGGDVSRLPWDGFPSALTLKDQPADDTRDAFAGRGALVLRAGIGVNFGIVADVTADPSSFIYRRALGTTPDAGAARVGAAVAGEQDGAASTLKHFPGHGAAAGDSHVDIPSSAMSKDAWRSNDAIPFRAGIDAGTPLVMFGHLAYTAVDRAPASMSGEWHRILREELGFDGVAITDDLGMLQASGVPAYADPVANAVAAIATGNDMVLAVAFTTPESAGRIVDGIVAAVDAGTLPAARLDEAAIRVTTLRLELAAQGRGLVSCADCSPAG